VNLRGSYAINPQFRLFFNVNNVFDSKFETFGLFGEPEEVLGDEFDDSRFLSPGAPRGAWIGIEYSRGE
jgi:outer membrane receptor protein involved in Fe transport